MKAEVLIDALSQVSGVPTQFKVRYGDKDLKDMPLGKRAMELPDVDADSFFFKSFGRPARQVTCECERSSQPTMVQVLHISNGDTVNQKLQSPTCRITKLLADNVPDRTIVEELYLSALTRLPSDDESARLTQTLVSDEPNRRQVIEDLYWSVLSSKEFLFNH